MVGFDGVDIPDGCTTAVSIYSPSHCRTVIFNIHYCHDEDTTATLV